MNHDSTIENILRSFHYDGKIIDLLNSGYVSAFNTKNNEINCIMNVTENNKNHIRKLCIFLKKTLSQKTKIHKINFAFTGVKLPANEKNSIPRVKHIVLVSSGKGGVGKSTIAFNIASALAQQNIKVGLVDADIYGPSIPTFTNHLEAPKIIDNYMIPHNYSGIMVNSIGYLIPQDKALVWRGPMITKALHQLLSGTNWGDLEYLIVDMPPGTGDIHLTLIEKYNISGAIMVSTPESLALADVSRAIDMYIKMKLNIFGIIENMSYLEDQSGKKNYIFGNNKSLKKLSRESKVPIISQIPFSSKIRKYTKINDDDFKKLANKVIVNCQNL